jgi:broad specificity phosphatase PhoE
MAEKKLIAVIQRHGSTVLNEDNCYRGRSDPALDERGIKQAEDAVENLKLEGIELKRIVSSPMLRACQTADIIAEAFGLDVEQDRAIISWDLGFLSAKDRDEYGPVLDIYVDNPKLPIPGGESLDDLEQRLYEYFNKEFKKDKLTLYCTHNSDIVTLETMIAGDKVGRPEASETTVQAGGTLGIYTVSEGKYSTEVMFGTEKKAEFGS